MLLPALAALHLRLRQARAPAAAGWRGALPPLAEGACWAAGCLFKPFVAVPGLLVWLAWAGLARRSGRGWGRALVREAGWVLAGGLLVGAAWQGWLLASGSWGTYWHNVRDFRGDFYSQAPGLAHRCMGLLV